VTIIQPIFIFGAARSGTTLLYHTLCNHADLAYITDRENYELWKQLVKYRKGTLGLIRTLADPSDFKPRIASKFRPNEGNGLWVRYLPHFKYMTEDDVTPEMERFFKENIERIQNDFGRNRFINKNPKHGHHVRLLNRLFPDARFIHIIRDVRAVASSELVRNRNVKKALGDLYQPERSYMFNLGLLWKETVTKGLEARQFTDRYYEVSYETLVANPLGTLKDVLNFCQLEWSSEFESRIPKIEDMNYKWKENLKEQDIRDLERAIEK
jgi:hypothetical protein